MSKSIFWKDVVFPGDSADLSTAGVQGLILPRGTTPERAVIPIDGTIRYNITLTQTEVYQSGAWTALSTAASTGEANTASNLGSGTAVFAGKTGVNLEFKTLVPGSNVSIGTNANEIIINATSVGEANDGINVGTGTGEIYSGKLGNLIQMRRLNSTSPNLTIVNNSDSIDFAFTGGVGEINTGSNSGIGAEIFRDKVSANLRFRRIDGVADQIDVVQNINDILIGLELNPIIPGVESIRIPTGPSLNEPLPFNGMLRYDTTTDQLRAVVAGNWETITTAAGSFLSISGGTMAGDIVLDGGVNIVGSVTSSIFLSNSLFMQAGANIDMSAGGSIIQQSGATVDGRDVSEDGATLDNINQLTTTGLVTRTADPNTFAFRTLTGTVDQITVTNGNGVTGDPTVALAPNPIMTGTGSVTIPLGTTAEQPATPVDGMLRLNTDDQELEFYLGGSWISPISTIGGAVTGGDIDMAGNNIVNINLADGRDLTVDGVTIDQLTTITDDTGVLVKTGGVIQTQLLTADTMVSRGGIEVLNGTGVGPITVGLNVNGLPTLGAITGTEEIAVFDGVGTTNAKTTINDIITFIGSSGIDSELDVATEFGFVARIADGVIGDFERRIFEASVAVDRVGLNVINGNGISGNPTIGLDIASMPLDSAISSTDIIPVSKGAANVHTTMSDVRAFVHNGAMRGSLNNATVNPGTSILPLSVNPILEDFDPDNTFDTITDSVTPEVGTYQISIYVLIGALTVAGEYDFRVLKNGIDIGASVAYITADGTTSDSVQVTDTFVANGIDNFSVRVTNNTGAATSFTRVRMNVIRIS